MDVSLFFFSADSSSKDRYRFLLETTRFADEHGFNAVWMPERHFTRFGGLYPNPAVVAAAIAVTTSRIRLRAGSLILPLHDPLRVVEEWSVVDNLSNGRVEISFGSGWNVNDFVFYPERYDVRREWMREQIDLVRELWRGGTTTRRNGAGRDAVIRPLPRPVQPELPVWLTAQSDATFVSAGADAIPILTNLNFNAPGQLASRIQAYHDARRAASAVGGRIALMVHTFIGETDVEVDAVARPALRTYLQENLDLRESFAAAKGAPANVSDAEKEAIVERGIERLLDGGSLVGTPETCTKHIRRFAEVGVDELACLIDFGPDLSRTLASLRRVVELRASLALQQTPRETVL